MGGGGGGVGVYGVHRTIEFAAVRVITFSTFYPRKPRGCREHEKATLPRKFNYTKKLHSKARSDDSLIDDFSPDRRIIKAQTWQWKALVLSGTYGQSVAFNTPVPSRVTKVKPVPYAYIYIRETLTLSTVDPPAPLWAYHTGR